MKDNELIKAAVENFIIQKNYKFKPSDIRKLLKDSVDIKINKIKEEKFNSVKILYIYFGLKKINV